jgi:hypothetical protein
MGCCIPSDWQSLSALLTACTLWCRVAAVEKAEAAKINVVKAAEADAEAKFLQGQVGPQGAAPMQLFLQHKCSLGY